MSSMFFSMGTLTSAVLLFLSLQQIVSYPTGAGDCPQGTAAVTGHIAAVPNAVTGPLAAKGLSLLVDDSITPDGGVISLTVGVPYTITLLGGTFLGHLIRIGVAASDFTAGENSASAAVCMGTAGITHYNAEPKFTAGGTLLLNSEQSDISVDVTAVVQFNISSAESEYYYSSYTLNAVAATVAPVPVPIATPATAPPVASPTIAPMAVASPSSIPLVPTTAPFPLLITPTQLPIPVTGSTSDQPSDSPSVMIPSDMPSDAPSSNLALQPTPGGTVSCLDSDCVTKRYPNGTEYEYCAQGLQCTLETTINETQKQLVVSYGCQYMNPFDALAGKVDYDLSREPCSCGAVYGAQACNCRACLGATQQDVLENQLPFIITCSNLVTLGNCDGVNSALQQGSNGASFTDVIGNGGSATASTSTSSASGRLVMQLSTVVLSLFTILTTAARS